MAPMQLLVNFLIVMAALKPILAVQFQAFNNATGTPGGTRFDNEIGIPFSQETLQLASEFIWQTFKQEEGDRKNVEKVTMIIESLDGVAYEEDNSIHVSSEYIANYSGDVRVEIIGVLYHETTHVWQWSGSNDDAPSGLIEGIADYVRLKSGWAPPHWPERGTGMRWDEGYAVTAYFLEYCNGLKDGFVAEINGLMKNSYSDDYFVQLLGKTVDDLWKDYKAQFSA